MTLIFVTSFLALRFTPAVLVLFLPIDRSAVWEDSSCTYWPPSQSYSQRGDCHIVFSIHDIIQVGIAAEWKTSRVLQTHIQEIVASMILPEGQAEDWAGIVKKIALHMGTTYMDLSKRNEDRILDPASRPAVGVHYGLLFSGQACVVAQNHPPVYGSTPDVAQSNIAPYPLVYGSIPAVAQSNISAYLPVYGSTPAVAQSNITPFQNVNPAGTYDNSTWSSLWPPNGGNIPLSQFPAPMPHYSHPYPYFQPPQQMPQSAFPPPVLANPALHPSWEAAPPLLVPQFLPSAALTLPPTSVPNAPIMADAPSYRWPDGNVKLECTTGQEPMGWDDEGWKWRSTGSRKGGLPADASRVDKRVCLGVFHCSCIGSDGLPNRFYRPKSAKGARDKQHEDICHICRRNLIHVPCSATLIYYQYVNDAGVSQAVRQHTGNHSHSRPPVTKLSQNELEALDQQVRQNPQASAQQLRAGAGASQISIGEIAPILLNSRKARHEVEKSKVRQQILAPPSSRNSGFQLLQSFSSLKESFETPWIVKADLLDRQFICMQTPFMRDVLLRDSVQSWHTENLEPESGRHGIITDGTHDFFKEGVLLTSLVFSQVVLRWVVVLYTWIGRQNVDHHTPHFSQLVNVIAEICTAGLGYTFDDQLFSAILDFSNAQRNGFIEAFVSYMCSRIPAWNTLSPRSQALERASLKERAMALLIGCGIHWKRSTHKIKQVVGFRFLFRFEALISILEASSTTSEQFLQAVDAIFAEFPEVRPWLSWWILPGNGGMIFPAMQKMPADLREKLPGSTNGAESAHNMLYQAAGRGHDIWEGVRRLYRVQRETEMLYEAVTAGHVEARFQGSKPQPNSRLRIYENDGRAPDTRSRLAAVQLMEAELAAKKSQMSEDERFITANSQEHQKSSKRPSEAIRPPGSNLLQSYSWDANSCFIDAPLEAYFRAFGCMSDAVRAEFLRRIRTEAADTGLRDIMEHFWLRGLLSGAVPSTGHSEMKDLHGRLMTALDAGQRNVKRLLNTKWDSATFVPGMPGCARTWLNQMIIKETTPRIQRYFGTQNTLHYICHLNHSTARLLSEINLEIGIHGEDLSLIQQMEPGTDRPSLEEYLIRRIPRERYGSSRSSSFSPLHIVHPTMPCSDPNCDADAELASISTEWPLLLRVTPVWGQRGDSDQDPSLKDLYCPLVLNLGPDVEYEMISRVFYIGPTHDGAIGHYITETRVRDGAYLHNDQLRNGSLASIGPLYVLEQFNRHVSFVVYLRRSLSSTTSRNIREIQQDFAKIVPASQEHISVDSDLESEVNEMILDALGTSTQNSRGRLSFSPSPTPEGSRDDFYTPEQSPQPTTKADLGSATVLRSPADTDSTTPCPLRCDGCGVEAEEGDDDPNEVQCEKCRLWSHTACLDKDVNWDDPDVRFVCTICETNHEDPLGLFKVGEIVMLPNPFAKDEWRADSELEDDFSTYLLVPTTYKTREFCQEISAIQPEPSQEGWEVILPSYANPYPLSAHENPQLSSLFALAITPLAKILAEFNTKNAVIDSYTQFFAAQASLDEDARPGVTEWRSGLHLDPTMPELRKLIRDAEDDLMAHPSLSSIEESQRKLRTHGVGYVLLQLLAIQVQLGEPLNLNGDTLKDLADGSIRPVPVEGVDALTAMFVWAGFQRRAAKENWTMVKYEESAKKFYADHSIFDPDLRPPTFERIRASENKPSQTISVDEPKRNSHKRKNVETVSQRGTKRAKISSEMEEPGVEFIPIFALILGVLAQSRETNAFRDPAVDPRLKETWFTETLPALRLAARFVHKPSEQLHPPAPPLQHQRLRHLHLVPPPPALGAGSSLAGGAADHSSSTAWPNSMYSWDYAQQQVLLHFDFPGAYTTPRPLMSISRAYIAEKRSSSPSTSITSTSTASSVSTPPSSPEPSSLFDRAPWVFSHRQPAIVAYNS
ncbi:hypothetical protein C8J57DRAFT_1735720 [Mycena rebaudengoi]|nr:hypothetical protein C8J57DRAFT_1735720 [Mycena rebaudengoi]